MLSASIDSKITAGNIALSHIALALFSPSHSHFSLSPVSHFSSPFLSPSALPRTFLPPSQCLAGSQVEANVSGEPNWPEPAANRSLPFLSHISQSFSQPASQARHSVILSFCRRSPEWANAKLFSLFISWKRLAEPAFSSSPGCRATCKDI